MEKIKKKKPKMDYREVLKESKCKPIDFKTRMKHEQFSVSWDYDRNPENRKERRVVFLHVPDVNDHEHSHITLTRSGVKKLAKWLNDFLKETK